MDRLKEIIEAQLELETTLNQWEGHDMVRVESGILHAVQYNVTFNTTHQMVPHIMNERRTYVPQGHMIELQEAADGFHG